MGVTALPEGARNGFRPEAPFFPNNAIIPTLDDGPDGVNAPPDPVYGPGGWTTSALQYLDGNNLHFDFFLDTNNWCGAITGVAPDDPRCDAALVDILKLHNQGNHTVHHIHMGANIAPDATTHVPQGCDGATSMNTCDAEIQRSSSIRIRGIGRRTDS